MEILLDHGAKLNVEDLHRRTPQDLIQGKQKCNLVVKHHIGEWMEIQYALQTKSFHWHTCTLTYTVQQTDYIRSHEYTQDTYTHQQTNTHKSKHLWQPCETWLLPSGELALVCLCSTQEVIGKKTAIVSHLWHSVSLLQSLTSPASLNFLWSLPMYVSLY